MVWFPDYLMVSAAPVPLLAGGGHTTTPNNDRLY